MPDAADPGAVHRLRVQTRRLLAELALLDSWLPPPVLKAARRVLKKQLHAASKLRDTQVQLEMVDALRSRHAGLASFRRHLHRRERRAAEAMAAKLRRHRQSRQLARLGRELALLARGRIDAERHGKLDARAILQPAFARIVRLQRRAASDPDFRHRLRVALKRYRYLAEALPSGGRLLGPAQLRRVRAAQVRLGEIHDLTLLEQRLGRFAARHPAGPHFTACRRALAQRRAGCERRQRRLTPAVVRTLAPRSIPWPQEGIARRSRNQTQPTNLGHKRLKRRKRS